MIRFPTAKLRNLCELAKNANLILPIPIEKGIANAKGSHFFLYIVSPVLTRKLKEYILRFHGETPDPEAYLFYPRIKGTHAKTTVRVIQKWMKELAAKVHEDCEEVPLDLHPHNYRHAYGTRRIRQGKQLAVVQREMGHRCIQSTMTYIDTSSMMEQAQEAAESEEVRKTVPVWNPGDSLEAMYRSRFMT